MNESLYEFMCIMCVAKMSSSLVLYLQENRITCKSMYLLSGLLIINYVPEHFYGNRPCLMNRRTSEKGGKRKISLRDTRVTNPREQ